MCNSREKSLKNIKSVSAYLSGKNKQKKIKKNMWRSHIKNVRKNHKIEKEKKKKLEKSFLPPRGFQCPQGSTLAKRKVNFTYSYFIIHTLYQFTLPCLCQFTSGHVFTYGQPEYWRAEVIFYFGT